MMVFGDAQKVVEDMVKGRAELRARFFGDFHVSRWISFA
jgi:hypothetical protein